MVRAEQITPPVAGHGEGPVWSGGWGGLRYVDMLAGDVLHLDPGTGEVSRWHVGRVAAALRPRAAGGAVIATEHDFVVCDEMGGAVRTIAIPITDDGIRFNDGGCDPAGNFLCGTMAYSQAPGAGNLYRLGADHAVELVLAGVTISNGLAWTADGSLAYYIDTPTGRIDVFDSDGTGALRNRRTFVSIPGDTGHPDGLTVDAEGGVWCALWDGRAVHHYSPDGSLQQVVDVPTAKVTACTFGGVALDELYITTSREGSSEPEAGVAGALYRYQPGVTGLPVRPFAG